MQGLTETQRASARAICQRGCALLLAHREEVHYSQGPQRWEGIDHRLRVVRHEFPKHGDCSSTVTWILWNAFTHALGRLDHVPDYVNGEAWAAGYTATIAQHGVRVGGTGQLGDLVLYGAGPTYEHVTMALGGGMCFSHGGEAGPWKLPVDYRPVAQIRRFI